MLRICRFGKIFSSIAFIATLLITYAFLAEQQRIFIKEGTMELYSINTLFNASLITFIVFSLLIFIFSKLIETYIPGKLQLDKYPLHFKTRFTCWLEGLHISFNILFITLIVYVGFINSQSGYNLMNFAFLLYIGPAAVLITLLSLVWVFMTNKVNN